MSNATKVKTLPKAEQVKICEEIDENTNYLINQYLAFKEGLMSVENWIRLKAEYYYQRETLIQKLPAQLAKTYAKSKDM